MTGAEELSVEWTGVDGRRRRWTFIPDTSGEEGWRIEERKTPTGWLEVGREPVSDVELSGAALESRDEGEIGAGAYPERS